MIDPITALGLVSSVLQVADFSVRILSKANEIRQSVDGSIAENHDIEKCAKELVLRNEQLSENLIKNDGERAGWDKDDVVLTRLGHDCNGVAIELIECLSDLRSNQGRSTFKNVRQAIKTVYSKEKVESIAKRMKGFQEQMNSALLQSMSLRQRLMAAEQTTRFSDLDHGERKILDSVKNLQLLFTSQLNSQTDILMNMLTTQHDQTRDLINNLSLKNLRLGSAAEYIQDINLDESNMHQLAEQGSAKKIQALLRKRPQAVRSLDGQCRTPLHFAAKNGHAELVSYFIRKGADVNAEDDDFATPLHLAVQGDHISVVRILLQKGADPVAVDATHRQPRQYASNEEISWVLSHGPDLDALNSEGNSALFNFAVQGKSAVVKSLLEQNATPDLAGGCGGFPLMKAAQYGHLPVVKLLYEAGANLNARSRNDRLDTALGLTAMDGHLAIVEQLIDWGAEIDAMNGWHHTPLNEACSHCREDVAILLIQKGANPNTEDHLGCFPINKAAEEGSFRIVKALLESGKVDVDCEDTSNGSTALSEACDKGSTNMVRLLLEHSASPSHRDHGSWTPLHLAVQGGHSHIISLLITQKGCDVHIKTSEGETPLSLAMKYGHDEIARLLTEGCLQNPSEETPRTTNSLRSIGTF